MSSLSRGDKNRRTEGSGRVGEKRKGEGIQVKWVATEQPAWKTKQEYMLRTKNQTEEH